MSNILMPLQAAWHWFAPKAAGSPAPAAADRALREPASPRRHKPLRIVRILEVDQAPSHVGRMIISGRMSDVCAELDRLAARH